MRIVMTRSALQDIIDIWTYTAADNIDAADRIRDQIDASIRKLAAVPQIGYVRKDVPHPSLRFWRVRPYLIAYRLHGQT